ERYSVYWAGAGEFATSDGVWSAPSLLTSSGGIHSSAAKTGQARRPSPFFSLEYPKLSGCKSSSLTCFPGCRYQNMDYYQLPFARFCLEEISDLAMSFETR